MSSRAFIRSIVFMAALGTIGFPWAMVRGEEPANDKQARQWSDASGEFKIEARLVEVKDGKAYLLRTDGQTVAIATELLCAADQQYLAKVNTTPVLRFGREIIELELAGPTQFNFAGKRLSEILKALSIQHRIMILFDESEFAQRGNHPATIVINSAKASGETLSDALTNLFASTPLTFAVHHGVVWITRATREASYLETRVFLGDTLNKTTNFMPHYGNSVSVSLTNTRVVVKYQTDKFYRELAKIKRPPLEWIQCPDHLVVANAGDADSRPREWALSEQVMARVANYDFENTPLLDLAEYLAAKNQIEISVDAKALAAASIPLTTTFTFQADGLPLGSALSLMLESHNLCLVPHDLGLQITTRRAADESISIVKYNVVDLLNEHKHMQIMSLIRETVCPKTWSVTWTRDAEAIPSQYKMEMDQVRGILTIEQSYAVHVQIEKLLAELRIAKKR